MRDKYIYPIFALPSLSILYYNISIDELIKSVIEKQKEMADGVEINYNVLHVELFSDKHGFDKVITVLTKDPCGSQNNMSRTCFNNRFLTR